MVDGKSISLPFPFEGTPSVPPLAPGFGVDVRIEISESESESMLVKSIVVRRWVIAVWCRTVRRLRRRKCFHSGTASTSITSAGVVRGLDMRYYVYCFKVEPSTVLRELARVVEINQPSREVGIGNLRVSGLHKLLSARIARAGSERQLHYYYKTARAARQPMGNLGTDWFIILWTDLALNPKKKLLTLPISEPVRSLASFPWVGIADSEPYEPVDSDVPIAMP